ncbi:MAG: class I SAM-dependent methyltransferase [Tissierellales bacterium]|nr:class I SAM-dependent methyltransferase [Tissierellales bacterium]MBN2826903.1 class I SAM-dependent methyltransferase [Tissierellales bacterium]
MYNKINFFNITQYYHFLIDAFLQTDSIVVDCTCGNGNDTLYLCNTMKGTGFLYAFDVQSEAVSKTKELLHNRSSYLNYKIINDSHEKIDQYISEKINLAIYNLGYLPNSSSPLTTRPESTLISLSKALSSLEIKGYIVIAAYLGHDEGRERDCILRFLSSLNNYYFKVAYHQLININNYPPELFLIQKMHETI